jgi:hypothetical protein
VDNFTQQLGRPNSRCISTAAYPRRNLVKENPQNLLQLNPSARIRAGTFQIWGLAKKLDVENDFESGCIFYELVSVRGKFARQVMACREKMVTTILRSQGRLID